MKISVANCPVPVLDSLKDRYILSIYYSGYYGYTETKSVVVDPEAVKEKDYNFYKGLVEMCSLGHDALIEDFTRDFILELEKHGLAARDGTNKYCLITDVEFHYYNEEGTKYNAFFE